MPRCETCNRMQPSGAVRKMPSREAYRCKERFDCELAASNRDPYTAVIEITYPAKRHSEAWGIIRDLGKTMRPFPCSVRSITGPDGRQTFSAKEAVEIERPAVASGPMHN
jgi:hypothetical protein